MTPRRLKQLAANPEHIAGVYNYCDRWCERCPLTARCLNYAMGEEQERERAARGDGENAEFWQAMHDSFALTMQMIAEDCRERGIDFEELKREAAEDARTDERRRETRRRQREHPLLRRAAAYMQAVRAWFDAREALFEEKSAALASEALAGLPGSDPVAGARAVGDAVEVVRWYHMFISVKLARAVGHDEFDGDDEEDGLADETDPEIREAVLGARRSDSLGSAKVALVAIDRSLAAWGRLRGQFPDEADRMIDFLAQLDGLRREVERQIPGARDFVRPGFDDGTLDGKGR